MKVLCLLSGGSDSAYAALVAKQHWLDAEFYSLFVEYDQPELGAELRASIKVHNRLGFRAENWHSIQIRNLYRFDRKLDDLESIYIPLRNLVLASVAAARAEDIHADIIVPGNKSHHREEGEILGYDGNREFYKAVEVVVQSIEIGEHRIQFVPTLAEFSTQKLTRRDVYFGLWREGFSYADTFSCWFPVGDPERECGTCKNCVEKLALRREWEQKT